MSRALRGLLTSLAAAGVAALPLVEAAASCAVGTAPGAAAEQGQKLCLLQRQTETASRSLVGEAPFEQELGPEEEASLAESRSWRNSESAHQELRGKVAGGGYDESGVQSEWTVYQEELARDLAASLKPESQARLRVVLATYVGNEQSLVDLWSDNVRRLSGNSAGDSFDFAFFHYDGDNSLWQRQAWYNEHSVRLRHFGQGCPPMFWHMLNMSFVSNYDYVWMMDGDIHLGFFSWDVYRNVLLSLRPLASQPSVVPSAPSKRSSNLREMRMSSGLAATGGGAVAREASRSEVMLPVLSVKLWQAFHKRLEGNNLRNSWFSDTFWDLASLAGRAACGLPGVVLVDASPARHMDFRSLRSPKNVTSTAGCTFRAGTAQANNRALDAEELQLLASALAGRCPEARALLAQYVGWSAKKAHAALLKAAGPALRHWSGAELALT